MLRGNPEYHSWNFSIQRELPLQSVLELNHTDSRGTHLFMPVTTLSPLHPNYWPAGRTALNELVPNPFYGHITDPRSPLSREASAHPSPPAAIPTTTRCRLDAQNVTNTPMFGDPNGSFGSTNFGQITGLRNGVGPCNMQFWTEVLLLIQEVPSHPQAGVGRR